MGVALHSLEKVAPEGAVAGAVAGAGVETPELQGYLGRRVTMDGRGI